MTEPTFQPPEQRRSWSAPRILKLTAVRFAIGGIVAFGFWFFANHIRDNGTSTDKLRIGMCLETLPSDATFTTIDDTDCDKPHIAEVYDSGTFIQSVTLPSTLGTLDLGGTGVGDASIDEAVQRVCIDEQATRRRQALIDVEASVTYFQPSNGPVFRTEFFCVASFEELQSGSVTALS